MRFTWSIWSVTNNLKFNASLLIITDPVAGRLQEKVLDQVGTPIVKTISGFLISNPATAAAIDSLAQDQVTATYVDALQDISDTFGPLEKVLLVSAQPSFSPPANPSAYHSPLHTSHQAIKYYSGRGN
jgi:hypothetical protein